MQILLIVLALIGVYFLAKYSFFRADLSRNVDVFPTKGVPLVNRSKFQTTEKRPHRQLKTNHESLEQKFDKRVLTEVLQKTVPAENTGTIKPKIPEDAMLRRHFITQLKATIEVKLGSRPTDSCLARHYETMLQAEISKALERSA